MRKVMIRGINGHAFIALSQKKYLLSDITGLGTNYKLKKIGDEVCGSEIEFETINLTITFGAEGNPYRCYNEFVRFLAEEGTEGLTMYYQYNDQIRYCDMMLTNAPKTQKNNYNVITETFTFYRRTPWYTIKEFVTTGTGAVYRLPITNNLTTPLCLRIDILEDTLSEMDAVIMIEKDGNIYCRLKIQLREGYKILIDSENKIAIYYNESNPPLSAYDYIDHSGESFIVLEKGNFTLVDPMGLKLKIFYKEWMVD